VTLSSRERAKLRAEANRLSALVHVGEQGMTPALVGALDDALRTRELVKVQLGGRLEADAKSAARTLADSVHAEVVQVIGRTTTLYRHNPDAEKPPGSAPPWRR